MPTIRGLLRYATLNAFVADVAEATNINKPLPGGQEVNYYRWWDQDYYFQDEWRVTPDLTLNLGLRYERSGNNVQSLIDLNEQILAANNNNPAFELQPKPSTDNNNFQPRIGFNWSPTTSTDGMVGMLTGGDKFVLRGGYARTHDYSFLNIALNIASSFPYVAAVGRNNLANAFAVLQATPPGVPTGIDPNTLNRTVVGEDFRAPYADQFSMEIQRQLASDLAFRIGYVGTLGKDLFQTIDGNPRLPFAGSSAPVSIRHEPSSGFEPMRRNRGITLCRPGSRNASAAASAPACTTPGASTSTRRRRCSTRQPARLRSRRTRSTSTMTKRCRRTTVRTA